MKKIILLAIAISISLSSLLIAQDGKKVPQTRIKNLMGETVVTSEITNDGKPIIFAFWATWCKPCLQEMSAINEKFEEWNKETGVKVIAVSIDDSRNTKKVAPLAKGRGWKFDVLLDENSDFKRAMNVSNPPHSFLVNGSGEIVWEHTGYAPGDEEEMYDKIKELIKKD